MSGIITAARNAAVAQSVERRLGKAEVTGSIPVISFGRTLEFQGFFHFLERRDSPQTAGLIEVQCRCRI